MKYHILAALLAFAGGAAQTGAKDIEAPKECVPMLRIPVENYVPDAVLFSPPDGPVPYSVWRYNLYDAFCRGKPAKDCIWACAPVRSKHGAAVNGTAPRSPHGPYVLYPPTLRARGSLARSDPSAPSTTGEFRRWSMPHPIRPYGVT